MADSSETGSSSPNAGSEQAPASPATSGSGAAAPLSSGSTGSAGSGQASSGAVGSSMPTSHTAVSSVGASGHNRFAGDELAIVLSHYDIGVIEKIQPFPRGSRRAPKVKIQAESGTYLLKRRSRSRTDPYKVAFAHELQLHLADHQFPLPHLIGTRRHNNSMLKWGDAVYELFEFISGTGYDSSLDATGDAGRVLALFHKLLRSFHTDHEPASGSYHNATSVYNALKTAPQTVAQQEPDKNEVQTGKANELIEYLGQCYDKAVHEVEALGFSEWPVQIIHSDWHPGNMLFRGSRVVAVIDYDAARYQPPVVDIANGALQFSMVGGGEDPTQWPDYLDESRFKRFLRSYDQIPECVISRAELKTVPWLMMEALIAESVIPIAATGSFARMGGTDFLSMVARKVRWIHDNANQLIHLIED